MANSRNQKPSLETKTKSKYLYPTNPLMFLFQYDTKAPT